MRSSIHPARKRLLLGVLLLACTFFYAFAGTCGAIGQLLAKASSYLLGQTGSSLVAVTMLVVGVLLVVPHGAFASIVHWAWHGREARVARVMREMNETHRDRIKQLALANTALVEKLESLAPVVAAPVVPVEAPKTPPADRMKLDAVRGALKQLGYKAPEYEAIVAGLDPKVTEEILVRDALKKLHATN